MRKSHFNSGGKFWIRVLIILLQLYEKPTFSTWIGFQQHLFTHIEHHGGILPGGGPPGQKGHSVDGDIIVKCWHHIYKVILSVSFKNLKIIDKIKIVSVLENQICICKWLKIEYVLVIFGLLLIHDLKVSKFLVFLILPKNHYPEHLLFRKYSG